MRSFVSRLWSYVDRHHRRFGIGRFVLPALALPLAVIALVSLIASHF